MVFTIAIIGCVYAHIQLTTTYVPFYTPRRVIEKEIHGVPFILHEFWHSRRTPKIMAEVIQKQIQMNPEFDTYIYSEKEAIAFLKQHFDADVLRAYMGFKPTAYRSDLFRYCVLYIHGGVYMDTKMDFTVPLKELIVSPELLVLKPNIKWCGDGRGVNNTFLITPPKSTILRTAIDEIVKGYKARSYKENELDITGPCLLGDILNRTKQTHLREKAHCECKEDGIHFVFTCGGKEVARSYLEYRDEQQRMQKEPSYKDLYRKGDVYWN